MIRQLIVAAGDAKELAGWIASVRSRMPSRRGRKVKYPADGPAFDEIEKTIACAKCDVHAVRDIYDVPDVYSILSDDPSLKQFEPLARRKAEQSFKSPLDQDRMVRRLKKLKYPRY
jgi:hypothetical protein